MTTDIAFVFCTDKTEKGRENMSNKYPGSEDGMPCWELSASAPSNCLCCSCFALSRCLLSNFHWRRPDVVVQPSNFWNSPFENNDQCHLDPTPPKLLRSTSGPEFGFILLKRESNFRERCNCGFLFHLRNKFCTPAGCPSRQNYQYLTGLLQCLYIPSKVVIHKKHRGREREKERRKQHFPLHQAWKCRQLAVSTKGK